MHNVFTTQNYRVYRCESAAQTHFRPCWPLIYIVPIKYHYWLLLLNKKLSNYLVNQGINSAIYYRYQSIPLLILSSITIGFIKVTRVAFLLYSINYYYRVQNHYRVPPFISLKCCQLLGVPGRSPSPVLTWPYIASRRSSDGILLFRCSMVDSWYIYPLNYQPPKSLSGSHFTDLAYFHVHI